MSVGTVKLSRIRPFCGRILLDQRLRINDLAVAASGENAAKLLNLTVSSQPYPVPASSGPQVSLTVEPATTDSGYLGCSKYWFHDL